VPGERGRVRPYLRIAVSWSRALVAEFRTFLDSLDPGLNRKGPSDRDAVRHRPPVCGCQRQSHVLTNPVDSIYEGDRMLYIHS
jgi:hypothetical protein